MNDTVETLLGLFILGFIFLRPVIKSVLSYWFSFYGLTHLIKFKPSDFASLSNNAMDYEDSIDYKMMFSPEYASFPGNMYYTATTHNDD